MIETLIGVGVGGAIGVAGTMAREFMHTRRESRIHREKEALSIARRTLAVAQEAWESSVEFHHDTTGMSQKFRSMKSLAEARNQLLLSLHELSLVIPNLETETDELVRSVSTSTDAAETHDQRRSDYLDATTALRKRVQEVLKTKN